MSVRTTILDCEAVDVLRDPYSSKHPKVLRQIQAAINRKARGNVIEIKVPTAIRVEAGWDRQRPDQAMINRFPAQDVALDALTTDIAARLHRDLSVSVADAHLGAAIATSTGPITVLTSDIEDLTKMTNHLNTPITISQL